LLPTFHIARSLVSVLAVALGYALIVNFLVAYLSFPKWSAGNEVTTVLSVSPGVLVVFRNNTAHDRWWEARKVWGQLINDIRNLALKAKTYAAIDLTERRAFARLLSGFAHALRLHLRGSHSIHAVPGFENDDARIPRSPGHIAGLVFQSLNRWNRQDSLGGTIWLFDQHARALMDASGACERIRNTPLASSYRAMMRGVIGIYVLTAPWTLALEMGWWSVPVLMLGFSFLLGIELTAEAVEEPFGKDGDDLPLESYCQTIDTFVNAALLD